MHAGRFHGIPSQPPYLYQVILLVKSIHQRIVISMINIWLITIIFLHMLNQCEINDNLASFAMSIIQGSICYLIWFQSFSVRDDG